MIRAFKAAEESAKGFFSSSSLAEKEACGLLFCEYPLSGVKRSV